MSLNVLKPRRGAMFIDRRTTLKFLFVFQRPRPFRKMLGRRSIDAAGQKRAEKRLAVRVGGAAEKQAEGFQGSRLAINMAPLRGLSFGRSLTLLDANLTGIRENVRSALKPSP